MRKKMFFAMIVGAVTINCGSNYGLLRKAMANNPKIVIITQPPVSKLWIAGQDRILNSHNVGNTFYDDAVKSEYPKEYDTISPAAAQEIKAQLKGQNVTILDIKKVPLKKESTLGIVREVPDVDKLGFDIVIRLVTDVHYYEQAKIPSKGPYTYELKGYVDAEFLEKKPDGTMGEMGIVAKIGNGSIKDGNEYSQPQTIEVLIKKVNPVGVVKPLTDSLRIGATELKAELDKKEQ